MQIEEVGLVQQKLRAASYATGGADYRKLFDRFDKDGNGELDLEEFAHMIKITIRGDNSRKLSENEMKQLWEFIDFDDSGTIDSIEFVAFLETDAASFAGFREMSADERRDAELCLVENERRRRAARNIQRVTRGKFARRSVKERSTRRAREREKDVREVCERVWMGWRWGGVGDRGVEVDGIDSGIGNVTQARATDVNSTPLLNAVAQARRQEQEGLRREQAEEIMRQSKGMDSKRKGKSSKRLKLKELQASQNDTSVGAGALSTANRNLANGTEQHSPLVLWLVIGHSGTPLPERSPSAKRLLNAIGTIQRKLHAASYTSGGTNYRKFFEYVDKDSDGSLDFDEFARMVRKGVRGDNSWRLSDLELRQLWDLLDANGDNSCDAEEFVAFLEMDFETLDSGPSWQGEGGGGGGGGRGGVIPIASPTELPTLDERSGTKTIFVGSTGGLSSLRDHVEVVDKGGKFLE